MPGVVNNTPYSACVQMQSYLAVKNMSGNLGLALGAHEALLSAANRDGFTIDNINGKGFPFENSNCKAVLKYIERVCGVTSNATSLCNPETAQAANPFKRVDFQFDQLSVTAAEYQLDESQFDCICDPKEIQEKEILNQRIRAILRAAEVKLLENLWDCLGKAGNCDLLPISNSNMITAPLELNIFSNDGSTAQAAGWWKIIEARDSFKMQGRPIVIGGSYIHKWLWMTQYSGQGAGSLNKTAAGNDVGIDFYYSSEFDNWITSAKSGAGNYAIVIMPGTAQLINYLDNVGAKQRSTPTASRNVIQYTNNGINYDVDLEILYKEDCHQWQILPKVLHEAFCLPQPDACQGDWYANANGRFLVKLGCGTVNCDALCPES